MVPLQDGPWRERGGELEVLDWLPQSEWWVRRRSGDSFAALTLLRRAA